MHFPMKIQPLDTQAFRESIRNESSKPATKSRLRRLFDKQFPSVLRNSTAEKPTFGELKDTAGVTEFEPSSLCLAKMVQNFIEENEKPSASTKCSRNRCNCFNGNRNDISDDEFEFTGCLNDLNPNTDALENLKSLMLCPVSERNVLADTWKIVDKNKACKRKDELRNLVNEGLILLGYDSSICKSRWDKSPSCPAGEYDYIDVITEGGDRLLIDVDFRSEFEIARSTGSYKSLLQSLPNIFVGKSDRLDQIISIVSEAARQSLKKKGMHIPPWRKPEYMRAKWLSPHARAVAGAIAGAVTPPAGEEELELQFGSFSGEEEKEKKQLVQLTWKLPAINLKNYERGGVKIVPGLASLLTER
ncbi:uncharacterized protein LOC124922535 [Impatiens glandulifera]|uniref:uncharacterized protein LOC124922535 n=1 Tax=Impatiens glandulifera TaxID=253017 RepID=UPI001FB19280|nr:uncharacterized protein LOC124922535 [Impatiens glandulifera]